MQNFKDDLNSIFEPTRKRVENINIGIYNMLQPTLTLVKETGIFFNNIEEYLEIENEYAQTMYNAQWLPYISDDFDLELMKNVITYKDNTEKIDELVCSYYNKDVLNDIFQNIKCECSDVLVVQLLGECIDAFFEEKYAFCIFPLIPFWEDMLRISYEKPNAITTDQQKKALKKMTTKSKFPEWVEKYYHDYIMFSCHNPQEIKENAPGRHQYVHGWVKKLPEKKVALNTILFTSLLINFLHDNQ